MDNLERIYAWHIITLIRLKNNLKILGGNK